MVDILNFGYDFLPNYMSGTDFFLSTFLISFLPLERKHLRYIQFITVPVFIILCLQVILLSLGIIHVEGVSADYGGEVSRVNTTIGAATGSAVILFILVVINYYLVSNLMLSRSLFILGCLTILLTLSRGAILCLSIFGLYIFFNNVSLRKLPQKIGIIIFCLFVLVMFNERLGVVDMLEQRIEKNDVTSGRDFRIEYAIDLFRAKPVFGNGSSYTLALKRATEDIETYSLYSPHNFYILILSDYGVFGLMLFLGMLICLIKQFRIFNKLNGISVSILSLLLITCNTEIVFIYFEFAFALLLLFSTKPLLSDEKPNGNLSFSNENRDHLSTF